MPNRYIQSRDNKDLTDERTNCPFDTDVMCARIYGDAKIVQRRKEILAYVNSVPELNRSTTDNSFMTRMEAFENTAKNTVLLYKHRDNAVDSASPAEYAYFKQLIVGEDGFPFSVHQGMLIPMIQVNCDEEQIKDWLPKAINGEFCGTYAQTEMSHGTNLKKLETTATYDPKTEEFVLHSPTITATKWIPGNMGKSSNFIVLIAQLYTQGKCYGPHAFMVQIRHPQTHEPMPGIIVGDIGPKIGMTANDNGFLRLNQVRIPRRNMLMGHSKVEPDGTYKAPIHSKIAYASMMFVRSMMISIMSYYLAIASTISIRYSSVRRQGTIVGEEEVKVLGWSIIFLIGVSQV
jgi:acyl-CoA oxidase